MAGSRIVAELKECEGSRFGVGIGVGIGDLEWVSEWVTATVYLQPSRAEASPLSLIGDG